HWRTHAITCRSARRWRDPRVGRSCGSVPGRGSTRMKTDRENPWLLLRIPLFPRRSASKKLLTVVRACPRPRYRPAGRRDGESAYLAVLRKRFRTRIDADENGSGEPVAAAPDPAFSASIRVKTP